ncbi:MAG TPA: hypothetical protein VN703_07360 [Candidatus Sulfopaludibacter sp.]|nr:hypothetical protein [Candidatus Sulfopaludibacter sp.]
MNTFLNRGCCQYNRKHVLAYGLVSLPSSKRTFDRHLKTISSSDVKESISTIEYFIAAIEGKEDLL